MNFRYNGTSFPTSSASTRNHTAGLLQFTLRSPNLTSPNRPTVAKIYTRRRRQSNPLDRATNLVPYSPSPRHPPPRSNFLQLISLHPTLLLALVPRSPARTPPRVTVPPTPQLRTTITSRSLPRQTPDSLLRTRAQLPQHTAVLKATVRLLSVTQRGCCDDQARSNSAGSLPPQRRRWPTPASPLLPPNPHSPPPPLRPSTYSPSSTYPPPPPTASQHPPCTVTASYSRPYIYSYRAFRIRA
jgi:hypothetical protein